MNLEEIARRRYEVGSEADLQRVTAALAIRARALYGGIPPDAEMIPLPALPEVPYREAPEASFSEDVARFLERSDIDLMLRAGITQDDQLARLDLALLENPNEPLIDFTTIVRLRQAAVLAQFRAALTDTGRETFGGHLDEFARGGIRPSDLPFLDPRLAERLRRPPRLDDVGPLEPGAPAWHARGALAAIETPTVSAVSYPLDTRDAQHLAEAIAAVNEETRRTGPSAGFQRAQAFRRAATSGDAGPSIRLPDGLSERASHILADYLAPMTMATMARGTPEERRARAALHDSVTTLGWQTKEGRAAASAYLHLELREAQRLHTQALHAPRRDRPALRAAAHRRYLSVLSGAGVNDAAGAAVAARSATILTDLGSSMAVTVAAATAVRPEIVCNHQIVPGRIADSLGGRKPIDWVSDGIATALLPALKGAIATAPGIVPPPFPTAVPGTLWRFDFLLEEARRVAEQAAVAEGQLLQLAQLILTQALSEIGTASDAVSSVGAVLNQKAAELEAIAAALPNLIDEVVHRARRLAAMRAILQMLGTSPTEIWSVGLGNLILDHLLHDIDWPEPWEGDWGIDLNLGRLRSKITDYFMDVIDVDGLTEGTRDKLEDLKNELNQLPGLIAQVQQIEQLVTNVLVQAGVYQEEDLPLPQPLPGFPEIYAALQQFSFDPAFDEAIDEILGADRGWLRDIVFAYFSAPLVAGVVHSAGLALTLIATQEIISRIVGWLLEGGLLDVITDLERKVGRAMADVTAVVDQAMQTLANLATLQAQLNLIWDVLQAIEGLLPDDLKLAMLTLLQQTRSIHLGNIRPLALTAERAFFRETAEFVDWIPETYDQPLTAGAAGVFDSTTGLLGSHVALADLGRLEAERVRRGSDKDSITRRVISLKDLLGGGNLVIGSTYVNKLLTEGYVAFDVTAEMLDRYLPGTYRAIVKDVEVLVRFALPPQFPVGTELSDAELTRQIADIGSAGLLVDRLSLPTGIPATLTQAGESRVRIPKNATLEAEIAASNPKLAGVAVADDPNDGAQDLGYRMLVWDDDEETQALSHFDIQDDTVRFTVPPRQLKPFENRGAIGAWRIDVPALTVSPRTLNLPLPTIDDIFVSFGYTADYDPALATEVAQKLPTPPPPAPLVTVTPPTDLGEVVAAIGTLHGTVEVIAADVTQILGILQPAAGQLQAFTTVLSSWPNAAAILAGIEPLVLPISDATLGSPAPPLALLQVVVHPVVAIDQVLAQGTGFPLSHELPGGDTTNLDAIVGSDGRAVIEGDDIAGLSPVGTWTLTISASTGALLTDFAFGLIYGTNTG